MGCLLDLLISKMKMGEKIFTLFCIVGKGGTVYETKHGDAEIL